MSSTYVRTDDTADLFDDTESTNGKPTIRVHQKLPLSTFRLMFDALQRYACDSKRQILWKGLFAILVFLTGMLLGFLIKRAADRFNSPCTGYSVIDYDAALVNELQIEPSYIRDLVDVMAKTKHLAGSVENQNVENFIISKLNEIGVPFRQFDYKVALYEPNAIGMFYLKTSNGDTTYSCTSCLSLNYSSDPLAPFIAYSADVQIKSGDVMYVNYGRKEDFEALEQAAEAQQKKFLCAPRNGSGADGLVLLVRQSPDIPLSDVVRTITENCVIESTNVAKDAVNVAALFYQDPEDWIEDWNSMAKNVAGAKFTGNTAQFGNARGDNGDPGTPDLPSIDNIFRGPMEDDVEIPKIGLLPIGYSDAEYMLKDLAGYRIESFQGMLTGTDRKLTYMSGPGYQRDAPEGRSSWKASVTVVRKRVTGADKGSDKLSTITNLVATFEGQLEPDRYVIIGSHYDALPVGAEDSAAGVGILLALAKALKALQNSGRWRPRRTLVLAFWDAEEFGAVGSTEFLEQFGTEIAARTVAYINLDAPVLGVYTFYSRMHPLIAGVLFDAADDVRIDVGNGAANGPSVYKRWCERAPFSNELSEPDIIPPGSQSDVSAFWHLRGIPFLFPQYRAKPLNGTAAKLSWPSRINWPIQHTDLDKPLALQRVMDMGFAVHATFTKVVAGAVLRLLDSALIPYDPVRFTRWLELRFNQNLQANYNALLQIGCGSPYMANLRDIINTLLKSAKDFAAKRAAVDVNDAFALRRENDRMMLLVEAFETDYNFEFRRSYSLLFDYADGYHDSPMFFPGITRALQESKEKLYASSEQCKREMSALMLAMQAANRVLMDDLLDDMN